MQAYFKLFVPRIYDSYISDFGRAKNEEKDDTVFSHIGWSLILSAFPASLKIDFFPILCAQKE